MWRTLIALSAIPALAAAACAPAQQSSEGTTTAAPTTTRAVSTSLPPPPAMTSTPPPLRKLTELEVWAFPGPNHYEGDVLTFAVPLGGFGEAGFDSASVAVDGAELATAATLSGDPLLGDFLVFADAFDTSGAVGGHWVEINASLAVDREIRIEQRFVVRPAAGRPPQEARAEWLTAAISCCDVIYLSGSAAERDIDMLTAVIDESAEAVEDHFGLELPPVRFVLIDTLWGNGGYAAGEVVVSYLDRDYSPGRGPTFRQTVLHELAHVITEQIERTTPWPLTEGVAVQFTGGHFKSEPLGARARAMLDADRLPSLEELFDDFVEMQHETRYAAAGAFSEFLVQRYGLATMLELFSADVDAAGSRWLDLAGRLVLGSGLAVLEEEFLGWAQDHEPGDQLRDLSLTVSLQEARRQYQLKYAPYPNYFVYPSATETGQASLVLREAQDPARAAVEALIAYGQDLIIEGDLDAAAPVVAEVERIVAAGTVGTGISAEFLAIAEALAVAGYQLLSLEPGGDQVTAVVTDRAPILSVADLERRDDGWDVAWVRPAPSSLTALGF